jgi:hypothetical protein
VLSEGEIIGTSDDVIVSVFQADDGVHWSVSRRFQREKQG